MSESTEEKDLPASARRRSELRERGMVPKSLDVTNTAVLATGLFSLMWMGPAMAKGLAHIMIRCFTEIGKPAASIRFPSLMVLLDWDMMGLILAFFALILTVAAGTQFLQVGFVLSTQPLEMDINRLNPIEGFRRLFSIRRLVQMTLSIIKLIIIIAFVYSAIRVMMDAAVFKRAVNVEELGVFHIDIAWQVGWRVLLALGVITLVDYGYQRWQFENDNKMSLYEFKEEMKQTEGSPLVKNRRRALQRKKTVRKMMDQVKEATIVITNPTHYAIALRYVRGVTPVPIVLAKGARLIAKRIKLEAANSGIPMMENRPLAQGLFKHAQLGQPIPILYYQAVATILAQLFRRGFVSSPLILDDEEEIE